MIYDGKKEGKKDGWIHLQGRKERNKGGGHGIIMEKLIIGFAWSCL